MALKQTLEVLDVLDDPSTGGEAVRRLFADHGWERVEVRRVEGPSGGTDFVRVNIPGGRGKAAGGSAPTTGIVGRLGGVGARPARIGLVSDADGAAAVLAAALKLAEMHLRGDRLAGDVVVSTHVCPSSPILPHEPVPFMGAPVPMETMNRMEVTTEMDVVLSVDTTKGNRVLNHRGIAISPTIKEGYILRVSDDLLHLYEIVTGRPPVVLPVTTQDITPYGNGLRHLNSIFQPATATSAPLVAVAITTETTVPGCATGASHEVDISLAARFVLEVAKEVGEGRCSFYDRQEWEELQRRYGSLAFLQTLGRPPSSGESESR